ncbi:hypothetical protein DPMN_023873 [Dreissena polymorpha]|uniref:Uncharacterized protein n=1 Tax=Dreissena polymorpha TaxID=45954 RepID=A0A9D4LNI1_DREPO|nr:hypothetical protein DPMN_023873 [Dreissena polymorpha]
MGEYMVAAAWTKTEEERDIDMITIINPGVFKYNLSAILGGKGCAMETRYQKRFRMHYIEFALPCLDCYGFYARNYLCRHTNMCKAKIDKRLRLAEVVSRSRFLISGGLVSTLTNELSVPTELQNIVNGSLILLYGQVLISHLGSTRHKYVAKRMRHLGRLKMQLNELKEQDVELNAYISPCYFDAIITAVKSLGGYHQNEDYRSVFEAPSLALSLGYSLVRLSELKRGIAIQRKSFVSKSESDNFIKLDCNHWNRIISSIALRSLKENAFKKSMVLFVVRDLLKINCYLHARLAGLTQILSEKTDRQVWKLLADVTLASIILFNRRRSTEVAQLLRRSYRQRMYGHEAMDAGVNVV